MASWRAAYRGQIPQDVLDALSVDELEASWRSRIQIPDTPEHRTWVAQDAARVVGFAFTGPSRDADADPASTGEVYAIYLDPSVWDRGFGRALLTQAVEAFEEAGYDDATLWVFGANARARGFYEAAGWVRDGATRRDRYAPEVRYRKDLRRRA